MPAWPATLPQRPLARGYGETAPDVVLRTAMDQGPDKTRRRATDGVRLLTVPLLLTAAQVETLDSFFSTRVAGGALSFTFSHPRTGVDATLRFRRPPTYAAEGTLFRAALSLEVLP